MSKEQTLNQVLKDNLNGLKHTEYFFEKSDRELIYKAMQSYADQEKEKEVISFMEFMYGKHWPKAEQVIKKKYSRYLEHLKQNQ